MFHRINKAEAQQDSAQPKPEESAVESTKNLETGPSNPQASLSLEDDDQNSAKDDSRDPISMEKPAYSSKPYTPSDAVNGKDDTPNAKKEETTIPQSKTHSKTQKDTTTMTDKTTTPKIAEQNEKLYSASQSVGKDGGKTPASNPYAPRPSQIPARGGYPGSYVSSVAAYKPAPSPIAKEGERRLTIGGGITMSGEIESCDYLLVEGTVEAALKGARILEIAESGTFYGTVEIQEATIAGRFEGDITVYGRLTLAATAVITGSITYRELEVETGAVIDGRLTPAQAVSAPVSAPQTQESSAQVTNTGQSSAAPANSDNGLFNDGGVSAAE